MDSRSPFAGGDQRYLRDEQYGDTTRLDARTSLHRRFSTSDLSFPAFEAGLVAWREASEILEVGAGTGRFWSNPLTPRSAALTLTDLSPRMVEAATALARSEGYRSVVGRECDVQALPFEDGSFDVVIANHMLYHVPDPDLAIKEMARVLRGDGVLLASTNGYGHMREMNDAIAEVFGDHQERLYEVFGIDTGESRLRQGFAAVSWHAYDNDLAVTDLDAAVSYGRSFPPGENATPAQQAAFREALQRRFAGGTLVIRTRTGAFVCRQPRRGPNR